MLRSEKVLPIETLRELIALDRESGNLYWVRRDVRHFNSKGLKRTPEHAAANWNSRYAGKQALASVDGSGHLTGRIFNRLYYAHRVVFALVNGYWPNLSIDHINGNPSDNRPENLRDVSHQENHKNQRSRKNNSSGYIGVNYNKRLAKWCASICINYRPIHIGYFEDISDAIEARKVAEIEAGFHENHGRVMV